MARYRDDGEVQIDNSTNGRFRIAFQWLIVIAVFNVGTLLTTAYISVAIYLPLVLTVLHGITPLYVGLANGLMSLGWSIAAAISAAVHGSHERQVVIAAPICLMIGSVGLALVAALGAHFAWVLICAPLVGSGMGIFQVHMTIQAMGVARPGEESITASSLQTIRTLGMAFGAAVAGTIGNVAGLQEMATPETVRAAVTWVYLFNVMPLILAVAVAARFFQVTEPVCDPNNASKMPNSLNASVTVSAATR